MLVEVLNERIEILERQNERLKKEIQRRQELLEMIAAPIRNQRYPLDELSMRLVHIDEFLESNRR